MKNEWSPAVNNKKTNILGTYNNFNINAMTVGFLVDT